MAMLKEVNEEPLIFATVVRPGVLRSEVLYEPSGEEALDQESRKVAATDVLISFGRYFVFRRIHSSSWFGLDPEPGHLCDCPAVESDYELLGTLDTGLERKIKIVWSATGETAGVNPRCTSTDANAKTVLRLAAIDSKPDSI
ncbi:hypothetical protein N7539_004425 [Penicillium diatomitis]|uniref:Uncharacterized protein n=1 Tax=Penicillium diatomitis TaxID=2819901 RepID=A0A9X0BY87_9EURO|nr:uncharacterized protein N7539_004425 [Penicillium diatomitis]KAJ5489535.1 hypothetical protein N7539_004425 [Penicillium diatomitis]